MPRYLSYRSALSGFVLTLVLSGCGRRTPQDPAAPAPSRPVLDQPVPANTPAVPSSPAHDPFLALYGEQGGEETLPTAPPSVPLRARRDDTFFRLSNPRLEPIGRRPFPFLAVDYERTHEGIFNGISLIVRAQDGRDQVYLLIGPFANRAGTIEINLGIAPPGSPGHPKNAELYLTRQEHRYGGGFVPTFKVSNSVLMGNSRFPLTLARNWTADEAAKLRQPPPEGPKANTHPEAGEETEFVGDKTGGGKFRYAEPGKPLLGVDFWAGEWDKEPCLARLLPVYEKSQPIEGVAQRVLAKPGYAVGALNVRTKKFVSGVQLVFMKLLPTGQLDPKDAYTSNWLGHEKVGTKETKLGGDGRRLIGFTCQQGAILNALAAVRDGG